MKIPVCTLELFSKLTVHKKAVLLAILLAFAFALMGVWVRMMADSFDIFQQSFLRIFLAAIFALIIFRGALTRNLLASITRREWTVYAIRAILAYAVGVGMFTIALLHSPLGTVGFITSMPILGVLAWVLFREKIPLISLPFVLLSIVGLWLITNVSIFELKIGFGEVASIIALLGFGLGYLMTRMHSKRRSNYENTTLILLIGWVPLFLLSLFMHEPLFPQQVSPMSLVGWVMSALTIVVGLYAGNFIFAHLKAYLAGSILLLEGLFAVVIGLAIYGEVLRFNEIFGGVLIIISAVSVDVIEHRAESVTLETA